MRHILIFFFLLLFLAHTSLLLAKDEDVDKNHLLNSILKELFTTQHSRSLRVGEYFGELYIKQNIEPQRWFLSLNMIPNMTRFDRESEEFISELFYQIHYTDYGVFDWRQRSYLTNFKHGSGEMELILRFLKFNPYRQTYAGKLLSPLTDVEGKLYKYSLDSIYVNENREYYKIGFKQKFENIRLLDEGWFVVDDSSMVHSICMKGWSEQCEFRIEYTLGDVGLSAFLPIEAKLVVDYNFLKNKLKIRADAIYDYKQILPINRNRLLSIEKTKRYDLTGRMDINWDTTKILNREQYARSKRLKPLTKEELELYFVKGISIGDEKPVDSLLLNSKKKSKNWLWTLGDEMLSTHSVDWTGGAIQMTPIVNPSYIDYSSSRGLSYKFAFNLVTQLNKNRVLYLKPMIGYNFKDNWFYWQVQHDILYDPKHRGHIRAQVGNGNRTYSSAMLDKIKQIAVDSLNFKNLTVDYFEDFYVKLEHITEVYNGVELLTGINYHKRTLRGNAELDNSYNNDFKLKNKYIQFAPHLRITWQPGMYYYMEKNRKINVGSVFPVFALDIEQGINGILGSSGYYTRSEIDIQYKLKLKRENTLYMRVGGGGFFDTKDIYFIDYAFLKHNNLPIERNDEMGGVFQLLNAGWYNSAKKYARANLTYESPFLLLHRLMPQAKIIQSERLYYNLLFISHLNPYMEFGYGIETPYLDIGAYVSSINGQFHQLGAKITITLFDN